MLDGEYGSVFKGRSLDFDDLRAYVPGDEVRDIDWKASARHGSPLIKRYVAVRRQTVLLVADTGRNMAADPVDGETKKDIAVMALGVVGYLAHRHGDVVGLVCGDATGSRTLPAKAGEAHLERLLRRLTPGRAWTAAPAASRSSCTMWHARSRAEAAFCRRGRTGADAGPGAAAPPAAGAARGSLAHHPGRRTGRAGPGGGMRSAWPELPSPADRYDVADSAAFPAGSRRQRRSTAYTAAPESGTPAGMPCCAGWGFPKATWPAATT